MVIKKFWCIVLLFSFCFLSRHSFSAKRYLLKPSPKPWVNKKYSYYRRAKYPQGVTRPTRFFGDILKDIYMLHANLFSLETFKIIVSLFPFFITTRMIDESVHRKFYDSICHKNINQMPSWCHDVAKWSISIPIVLLGAQVFLSRDDEMRITSRIFLLGVPFVIWTKNLLKKAKFDACLRPWNEKFSCRERVLGGFPSGHMAEAVYTAVLYGMRYGPKFAIPLSVIAAIVGVTFVVCNRHYVSQIIGGIGFGSIYAVAANKLIDNKLREKNIQLSMQVNDWGGPAISLSCAF